MLFDLQSPRRRNFIRVIYAMLALLMGVGLFFAEKFLAPFLYGRPLVTEIGALALLVAIGLLLFTVFCQLTGAVDLRRVFSAVLRRT